ncbi:macrodomain Ter protein MatP [Photobacterium salinisoli]|uniref:macrodomain Ter protein MatP n=1 Tax=Photobacterium salinisoli TaxID=1616783 RepID=UPI000EA304EA|nr:macrodomain Ter protein MatP [Photobacterium salinisoli]
MKYQQLENLEAGWKWGYLVKKYKEGQAVTRYIDTSEAEAAVAALLEIEHEPTKVLDWIGHHMSPELENKMKQAIRAKRKRHFNAEQVHTRKKSIDLDYRVWEKLADKSKELDCTLSDTIEYLLSESTKSLEANKKVQDIKQDLSKLLQLD